jgi:menaquinone-dependent protoporphyrinogen IX oxidase
MTIITDFLFYFADLITGLNAVNMKGIILYKTQYGSTEQYAKWLSEDTGLKAIPLHEADVEQLKNCEFIVIGSHIKVGHIKASDWIKSHWEWLKNKKLLLYSVSGSYANKKQQREVLEMSLPEDILNDFEYYSLPGKLDKSQLNFWDRIIVFLGSKAVPDEEAKERMAHGFDYVDHDRLQDLVQVVKHLQKKTARV